MTREVPIAIIGCGMGGMTAAVTLLNRSMPVEIFEQASELSFAGHGIAFSGSATRLLVKEGINLPERGNRCPFLEFRNKKGQLLSRSPIADGNHYRDLVGGEFLTFHRYTLQDLLLQAIPDHENRIHTGHELIAISPEDNGRMRLHFSNGTQILARMVIGADGVKSTTRGFVSPGNELQYSGELSTRFTFPTEALPSLPSPRSLHIWNGPGMHIVYYALDDGELVNLATFHEPDEMPSWTLTTNHIRSTPEHFLEIYEEAGWTDVVLDMFRTVEDDSLGIWALADVPWLPRWSRDRVVLMGDAAHGPLPHQGMGGGLALEDGYMLGRLVAEWGIDRYSDIFEQFEQHRRKRTQRVKWYTRLAGQVYNYRESEEEKIEKRNETYSNVPENIEWIHRHKVDEEVEKIL